MVRGSQRTREVTRAAKAKVLSKQEFCYELLVWGAKLMRGTLGGKTPWLQHGPRASRAPSEFLLGSRSNNP